MGVITRFDPSGLESVHEVPALIRPRRRWERIFCRSSMNDAWTSAVVTNVRLLVSGPLAASIVEWILASCRWSFGSQLCNSRWNVRDRRGNHHVHGCGTHNLLNDRKRRKEHRDDGEGANKVSEREDLLETLDKHRLFPRYTARDLTDEQARQRPTVSELSIGGLIKHVASVESGWVDFIIVGPSAMAGPSTDWAAEGATENWLAGFQMLPDESIAELLENYETVARRTDQLVRELSSLDDSHPSPDAPWFEQGARWSARRVLLHIIAETAQHAGHADIIRESLDGSKTMG